MAKTASEIVDRALTLIDEQVVEFLEAASTEMSVRDMGLEILPEVCRDLAKRLPYELKRYLAKQPTSVAVDALSNGESQSGYLKQKVALFAPSDFWEIVSVRLQVWARPVTNYILIDSAEYSVQNNPFTRAGKHSPVVALSNGSSGSSARIECFSINEGDSDDVTVFEYISFDNIPDDSGNTWPDELFDEVTKALSTQLNIIKSRLQQAQISGEQSIDAIMQHS